MKKMPKIKRWTPPILVIVIVIVILFQVAIETLQSEEPTPSLTVEFEQLKRLNAALEEEVKQVTILKQQLTTVPEHNKYEALARQIAQRDEELRGKRNDLIEKRNSFYVRAYAEIENRISLLENESEDPESTPERLQQIQNEQGRLNQSLNEMKDFLQTRSD